MVDIKIKILEVMAVVFNMDSADIPDDASPDAIEKWDSVNHMSLIIALEDEFNISFSDEELANLSSVDLIVYCVSTKLAP